MAEKLTETNMKELLPLLQECPGTAAMLYKSGAPLLMWGARREGEWVSALAALPTEGRKGKGFLICGAYTRPQFRRQGEMIALLDMAKKELCAFGGSFLAVPFWPADGPFWEKRGFAAPAGLHRVELEIKPDLFAGAHQDTLPAKELWRMRSEFPGYIGEGENAYGGVYSALYGAGATILHTEQAMGIYFKKGDTLYFPELLAQNDRGATKLLQAARNITGCFEAVVYMPAEGPLYLGQGRIVPSGLFSADPGADLSRDVYYNPFAAGFPLPELG